MTSKLNKIYMAVLAVFGVTAAYANPVILDKIDDINVRYNDSLSYIGQPDISINATSESAINVNQSGKLTIESGDNGTINISAVNVTSKIKAIGISAGGQHSITIGNTNTSKTSIEVSHSNLAQGIFVNPYSPSQEETINILSNEIDITSSSTNGNAYGANIFNSAVKLSGDSVQISAKGYNLAYGIHSSNQLGSIDASGSFIIINAESTSNNGTAIGIQNFNKSNITLGGELTKELNVTASGNIAKGIYNYDNATAYFESQKIHVSGGLTGTAIYNGNSANSNPDASTLKIIGHESVNLDGGLYGIRNRNGAKVEVDGASIDIDGGYIGIYNTNSSTSIGSDSTAKVHIGSSTLNKPTDGEPYSFAIYSENGGNLDIKADSIEVQSIDSSLYALNSAVTLDGTNISLTAANKVIDNSGSTISVGNEHAGSITLTATGETSSGIQSRENAVTHVSGDSVTITAGTNDIFVIQSQLTIDANSLNLTTSGDADSSAILAQNNSQDETAPATTSVDINAEHTIINAGQGVGISAFSNSNVTVDGNIQINAAKAIAARGNSIVTLNATKDASVVLNGDIVFETPGHEQNSGDILDANVLVNLTNENSVWTGNVYKAFPTSFEDNESLTKVDGFKLQIANGARWNATEITASSDAEGTIEKQSINQLTLEDGIVNLTTTKVTVDVDQLTGTGGTVNIAAKTAGNGQFETAQLSIGAVGEEPAALAVNFTGITADDLSAKADEDLKTLAEKSLTGNGASQIAQTRSVAEGDIRGAVTQVVDDTGEVTSTTEAGNTKLESFKGVNAASLVQWRNQVNHLTKRLGDVRLQQGDAGAWARVYGGEYKWGDANHVDMTSTTVQAGGDARVGDWIVGGAFSYSDSSFDLENGDGDGDLYTIALYGSRMFDKGSYIDFVARYGYIKNDFKAGNMDVSFDSNAFGLSVETGHTFKFMERAYVEPQIEVSYGYAQGDDAVASNGVLLEQDDYQNLITRIGLRTGFDFPENAGTIYAHVSYSYDFLGDADGTASKDGMRTSLSEDLGGGWVTYGIGGQLRLGQSTFAYGELERSTGGDVENPWAFNIGVRHLF